jgi:hypothetical protein
MRFHWSDDVSHAVPPSTSYNVCECSTAYEATKTAVLVVLNDA